MIIVEVQILVSAGFWRELCFVVQIGKGQFLGIEPYVSSSHATKETAAGFTPRCNLCNEEVVLSWERKRCWELILDEKKL